MIKLYFSRIAGHLELDQNGQEKPWLTTRSETEKKLMRIADWISTLSNDTTKRCIISDISNIIIEWCSVLFVYGLNVQFTFDTHLKNKHVSDKKQ